MRPEGADTSFMDTRFLTNETKKKREEDQKSYLIRELLPESKAIQASESDRNASLLQLLLHFTCAIEATFSSISVQKETNTCLL